MALDRVLGDNDRVQDYDRLDQKLDIDACYVEERVVYSTYKFD